MSATRAASPPRMAVATQDAKRPTASVRTRRPAPRADATTAVTAGPPPCRETIGLLDKYERACFLGTRALQIANDAPPLVDLKVRRCGRTVWLTDPLQIAEEELRQGVLPLSVQRELHTDAKPEIWSANQLALHPGAIILPLST